MLSSQFKQLMMLIDPNDEDEEDEKNKTDGGTSPTPKDDYNDPEHPAYVDPNVEVPSYAADEADALAATMQPTVYAITCIYNHLYIAPYLYTTICT